MTEFHSAKTTQLRLRFEPMGQDLNPAKTQIGTWIPCLLINITHLVSGLNEAQVLDVSSQKEFSERQTDR